jgi:hypothetical protein
MATEFITQLFAKKLIDSMADTLPSGPIDPSSEHNFFQEIIYEGITQASEQGISKKNSAEYICRYFFTKMINEKSCLWSQLLIYKSKIQNQKSYDMQFVYPYRNRNHGAMFGLETLILSFNHKFKFREFSAANKNKILFSKHSIERLYSRHEDSEMKKGSEKFGKYVLSVLYSLSYEISRSADIEQSTDLLFPIDGGVFLADSDGEFVVVKTFLSNDQLREDQIERIEPVASQFIYDLWRDGALVCQFEREEVLHGKLQRLIEAEVWLADHPKPVKVLTSIK